jgi:uncharacterized glyoxalase superfamily protein PhnB
MNAFGKLSPVLFVDRIEPCLAFWESLGFARIAEVKEGEGLGFVLLQHGPVEVMYQSRASLAKDVPALRHEPSHAALYLDVTDLDEVEKSVKSATVVFPRRTTFYGARELGVREPGGNLVTFSQQG